MDDSNVLMLADEVLNNLHTVILCPVVNDDYLKVFLFQSLTIDTFYAGADILRDVVYGYKNA
jgi:hypothetical protein